MALKIPKALCQYIVGDFPQKVMLRNTVGDIWSVRLVEWRNRIFIEHVWDAFTEDNSVV
jgi:hypothetical protein